MNVYSAELIIQSTKNCTEFLYCLNDIIIVHFELSVRRTCHTLPDLPNCLPTTAQYTPKSSVYSMATSFVRFVTQLIQIMDCY
jgi:hypothetical protein